MNWWVNKNCRYSKSEKSDAKYSQFSVYFNTGFNEHKIKVVTLKLGIGFRRTGLI